MLRSCSSVRMYPEQGRVRISVNNLIRGNAAETESNQIGLRSVRKMVEMHQGELYTFVETNIWCYYKTIQKRYNKTRSQKDI